MSTTQSADLVHYGEIIDPDVINGPRWPHSLGLGGW